MKAPAELSGKERRALVQEYLADLNPDAVLFDGLDDALVGYAAQFPHPPLAVYDRGRIVAEFQRQGMDYQGAQEYLEFNVVGLYAGPGTPLILDLVDQL